MSWAEVKKLNSDLTTPLNLAALINHIDMIGSSYVGTYEEIFMLLNTEALFSHSIAKSVIANAIIDGGYQSNLVADTTTLLRAVLDLDMWLILKSDTTLAAGWQAIAGATTGVGALVATACGSTNTTLINCAKLEDIYASTTAIDELFAKDIDLSIVVASYYSLQCFCNAAAVTFPIYFALSYIKNYFWDTDDVASYIMANSIARTWLLANKAVQFSKTNQTYFSTGYTKAWVLAFWVSGSTGDLQYLKSTGGISSSSNTVQSTAYSLSLYNLQLRNANSYQTTHISAVRMDI